MRRGDPRPRTPAEVSTQSKAINLWAWLPEGAIVKLKLKIHRKPLNMRSKVFLEAELAQKIDKYLYSSHRYGDFGDLVRASNFCEIDDRGDTDG